MTTRKAKVLVVGSKAIGLAAAKLLAELDALAGLVTIADSNDTRSRLIDLQAAGAIVVTDRGQSLAAMQSIDADLVLVAGWYWLIPPDVLATRPHIGIHHSLLPKFRGGSPLVWAMIHGAPVTGTSLFTLADEPDCGAIWAQASVEIQAGDYISDVASRCDEAAIGLVPIILDPSAEPRAQDHGLATWCAQRRPEDGLVDWSRPMPEVVRWIRAQSRPYPGAFTNASGSRVAIWRTRAEDITFMGTPGQVVSIAGSVGVICGDNRPIIVEESSRPLLPGMRLT